MQDASSNLVDVSNVEIEFVQVRKLVPSANNFFRPLSKAKFRELSDSIQANGLLVPILVRELKKSNNYEILSGHNRVKVFETIGKDVIPARIVKVNDNQAREILIDTNVAQRTELSPLETAQAYKEKMELLGKRQGQRNDINGNQKGSSRDLIGELYEVSGMTVDRYIRLLNLNEKWKDLLESNIVSTKVCLEISLLDHQAQEVILETLKKISLDASILNGVKAKEISKLYKQDGVLTAKNLKNILLGKSENVPIAEASPKNYFKSERVRKKWRDAEEIMLEVLSAEKDVLKVVDVSKSNLGYDLEVYKNGCIKYVEVKSVDNLGDAVQLTNNEYAVATQYPDDYILAIVKSSNGNVEVCFIEDPIANLNFTKKVVKIVWLCDYYEGNRKLYEVE